MATLDRQYTASTKVVPLAWHVDYWNYLGWEDPYSSSRFSERQKRYSEWLGGNRYTPQMIVDGQREFTGTNRGKAEETIQAVREEPYQVSIEEIAVLESKKSIEVEVTIENKEDPEFAGAIEPVLVLTEDNLTSRVNAGENQGKTLEHIAVVRSMKTLEPLKQRTQETSIKTGLPYDRDWGMENLNVVSFLQSKQTGEIVGLAESMLPGRQDS